MVLGAIESSDKLGAGAQLFWIVVATVVGLILTGPIRSFKTVVPGLDPNQSYLRTALRGVAGYLGARIGVEEAMPDRVVTQEETAKPNDKSATPEASPSARESLPALPSPEWVGAGRTQVVQLDRPLQRDALMGQPQQVAGRVWPGVVAAPSAAELPAAPPLQLASPAPVRPEAAPLALSAADADGTVAFDPTPAPDPMPAPSNDHETSQLQLEIRFIGPRPTSPVESDAEVIYPTGVIVADDESPLYRRSRAEPGRISESYFPMIELDLAEDGTEHELVRYHSPAGAAHAST